MCCPSPTVASIKMEISSSQEAMIVLAKSGTQAQATSSTLSKVIKMQSIVWHSMFPTDPK